MLNEILEGIESLEFKVKQYKKFFIKEISCKPLTFKQVVKGIKYDYRKINRD